jgi:hypothetical protein
MNWWYLQIDSHIANAFVWPSNSASSSVQGEKRTAAHASEFQKVNNIQAGPTLVM